MPSAAMALASETDFIVSARASRSGLPCSDVMATAISSAALARAVATIAGRSAGSVSATSATTEDGAAGLTTFATRAGVPA